jgi:hypothetical protein
MARKLRALKKVARGSKLARGVFKKVNIKLRKPKRLPNRGQPVGPRRVKGPGKWQVPRPRESMPARARKYQQQVTGAPPGRVYMVTGPNGRPVKFDGFRNGTLIETKGPGLEWPIKNGEFYPKFKGAAGFVDQAKRQLATAGGTPVRWEIAEAKVADAMRTLFRKKGITGIDVVHTPMVP